MSRSATEWAWNQAIKPASAKLVLLCLAKCHNKADGRCNPSVFYIANQTGLDRKTVITSLATLESIGAFDAIKTYGSWTQYNLRTSTEIGTGQPVPKSGRVPKTGLVPKSVPVEQEAVPILVPVCGEESGDQYRNRDTKEKNKTIKDKTYTSEHMRMAEWIWEKVQATTQSTKTPNLEAWADDIRKLNLIDNRDLRLIGEVFAWANNDPFWRPNVLSTATLRKQFDKLFAKFEGEKNGRLQKTTGSSGSNHETGQLSVADKLRAQIASLQ